MTGGSDGAPDGETGPSSSEDLTEVPGVDEERADALRRAGYETPADLAGIDAMELSEVDGVNTAIAARIESAVDDTHGGGGGSGGDDWTGELGGYGGLDGPDEGEWRSPPEVRYRPEYRIGPAFGLKLAGIIVVSIGPPLLLRGDLVPGAFVTVLGVALVVAAVAAERAA